MVGRALTPNDLLSFVRHLVKDASRGASNTLSLGLCVSGGPDSMALAYLFKGLEESHDLNLVGLIVDHKARPESTKEAKQVKNNLRKIGLHARILTMNWPAGVQPSELSAFESLARKKRYQLLSEAAVRFRMSHLLLGHHQDDQVETILMRLIRDKTLSLKGLVGMRVGSSIPAGDGSDRFGIHTDRIPMLLPVSGPFPPFPQQRQKYQDLEAENPKLMKIAVPGGPLLQRPLLNYTKSDLIATCESNQITYIIDPTNKDPRSNLRNAVRHLRTHFQLPTALGAQRVLKLQQTAREYVDQVVAKGNTILSTFHFLNFDFRVGSVTVKLRSSPSLTSLDRDGYAYAISRLIEMVTPNVRAELKYSVPQHIISRLNDNGVAKKRDEPIDSPKMTLTVGGVLFRQQSGRIWILNRQKMSLRSSEIRDNTRTFSINPPLSPSDKYCSDYLLWDNRFWVRVWAKKISTLRDFAIRPMRESDLAELRRKPALTQSDRDLRSILLPIIARLTPNKSISVIPVLTYKSRIVALPTFRYIYKEAVQDEDLIGFRWDVMYNAFSLLDQYPELRTWTADREETNIFSDETVSDTSRKVLLT